VFDVFGALVWENAMVPGVSGSKTVEVPYQGPALTPGGLLSISGDLGARQGRRLGHLGDRGPARRVHRRLKIAG
jgi:hypothetical protein